MIFAAFFTLFAASLAIASPSDVGGINAYNEKGAMVNRAVAMVEGFGSSAHGMVNFTQTPSGVTVTGTIYNLDPNALRGFHVHEFGDLSNGCDSTGEHYNPFDETHGSRTSSVRHVGDLGNINTNNRGIASFSFTDNLLSLNSQYSIIGRAIVVHAGTDDLGRGRSPLSSVNGNSGNRIACGVIGLTM